MAGRFLLMELNDVFTLRDDGVLDELALLHLHRTTGTEWFHRLPGNPGVKRTEGKSVGLTTLCKSEFLSHTIAELASKGLLALVRCEFEDAK